MAPSDALFWYAQQALPVFRPIIGGLYLLDRPADPEQIEAGYEASLALVPRLRQRVVEAPLHLGLPEWVEVSHVDHDYHLRHLSLPGDGTLRELLDVVATALATPFDPERPLWEAHWIDGLEGGRAAYFFKMHHSLVDGVGALAILDALTQLEREAKPLRVALPQPRPRAEGALPRLASLALDSARESARIAARAARASAGLLADPAGSLEALRRTLRGLRGLAADLARPPVLDPLAKGSSGLSRRLDVMAVPLERLRAIKAPLGCTINDLVLAALAGALGAYHRSRGVRVDALNCMVPMNLRGRDERDLLGNRVGVFSIVLPVGEKRPERRLRSVVEQTSRAKTDQRGAAMPFLTQALPLVPGAALRWLARNSLGRVNVACTNIPGVRERRYMAGAEIEAIYPFASVVEGTPVVIALLSYAGTMFIGIDTDPEAIPDPERIGELFADHLDELEALAARPRGGRARTARSA